MEQVHEVSMASLHGEFARVVDTREIQLKQDVCPSSLVGLCVPDITARFLAPPEDYSPNLLEDGFSEVHIQNPA